MYSNAKKESIKINNENYEDLSSQTLKYFEIKKYIDMGCLIGLR